MRVGQLWSWIYVRGATTFDAMSDVSKELRAHARAALLAGAAGDRHRAGVRRRHAQVAAAARTGAATRPGPRRSRPSTSPKPGRGTLCISSQVGCTLTCSLLPHRHAAAGAQPDGAGDRRPDAARPRPHRRLARRGAAPDDGRLTARSRAQDHQHRADGHGRAALQLRQRQGGDRGRRRRRGPRHLQAAHHALDLRRGAPRFARWGAEAGTMLAISLHATRDELRDELVPINRKYPIAELMAACRAYPGLSNARRITFEYVMLKGVNDSLADAKRAGAAARRHPGQDQPDPVQSVAGRAVRVLRLGADRALRRDREQGGLRSPVRTPRGRDIMRRLRPAPSRQASS